jgi:NAD(P)-dependent dehydrogenase (short-subunit alcohol dehydrogenase family)
LIPSSSLLESIRQFFISNNKNITIPESIKAQIGQLINRVEELEREKLAVIKVIGSKTWAAATKIGRKKMLEEENDSSFLTYVVVGVLGSFILFLIRRYIKGAQFTENVKPKGKVALVTGGSSGIGKQIARFMNIRGAKVYILCRSRQRGLDAICDLSSAYGCDSTRLILLEGDLADFSSLRKAVEQFNSKEDHLDFLINNAGIMFYPKFELTKDGHEMTWQSNYLGHFLLTHLLLPKLEAAPSARIVSVSSLMHKYADNVVQETVEARSLYNRFTKTYARSKLAQIMNAAYMTKVLRAKNPTTKITINSCHPGTVNTNLTHNTPFSFPIIQTVLSPFTWFFLKTDQDGAQTPLYLALSTKIDGISGKYFSECKEKTPQHPLAYDMDAAENLYNYSLQGCKIKLEDYF